MLHLIRLCALSIVIVVGAMLAGCGADYQRPPALVEAASKIPETVDYNWHVRPILSQNCFACHGNDANKRKAGLRLDVAEAAYGPLPEDDAKRAIVPGKPGESEMFLRILSDNPDMQMPPPSVHKTLTPTQIAIIERWIEQGAEYKEHWAYVKPVKASPPRSEFSARANNAIDQFVFARMAGRGMIPAEEADRETLINRAALDLTGLPPTLADVDAFIADKSPDAFEKMVDRMLASDAYGERQAAIWMDVARYAESDGYLDDPDGRLLWPWRDWLISAFNRNIPYDQFATWQIAGDRLPNPTREQLLATTFERLGKRSTENGLIDEEVRVDYVNERAELIGSAFLGLTVGCARCHDHKYDEISQADYYSLGGFFNSVAERGFYAFPQSNRPNGPTLPWPTADQDAKWTAVQLAARNEAGSFAGLLKTLMPGARDRAERAISGGNAAQMVDAAVKAATLAYYPLDVAEEGDTKQFYVTAPRTFSTDPRNLSQDPTKPKELPKGIIEADLRVSPSATEGIGAAGLERPVLIEGAKGKGVLIDNSRGFLAPGVGWWDRAQDFTLDYWFKPRADKAYDDVSMIHYQDHLIASADSGYNLSLQNNFVRVDLIHASPFNMISVISTHPIAGGKWTHITMSYDGSSKADGVKLYINGRLQETKVLQDNLTRSILPANRGRPVFGGDVYGIAWGLRMKYPEPTGSAIDEVRVFDRAITPIEAAYLHNSKSLEYLDKTTLRQGLSELALATDPAVAKAKLALRKVRDTENALATAIDQVLVMGDAQTRRGTYVLDRGLYNVRKQEVHPAGLPAVLKFDEDQYGGEDRLALTRWLFDRDNPLTARVYINRMWAGHFGKGIVGTVEDFGTQGASPTNPELLDWLAVEFMDSGWDIKHMHKLMVMSATYRQSSAHKPEYAEIDPNNEYLWRGPRYRLDAEQIRDNALFAAGLLTPRIGGDSAFPFQPEGIWQGSFVQPYPRDLPDDQIHRRSMYTFVKRTGPAPGMMIFDFADRNVSTVSRRISNTPLQSLALMNDPQFLAAYRAIAEHALQFEGTAKEQLAYLFRLATRRHPTGRELQILVDYRARAMSDLQASPSDVAVLLKAGVRAAEQEIRKDKLKELNGLPPAEATRYVARDASLDGPIRHDVRPPPEGIEPVELAATTLVATAVMNSPAAYNMR